MKGEEEVGSPSFVHVIERDFQNSALLIIIAVNNLSIAQIASHLNTTVTFPHGKHIRCFLYPPSVNTKYQSRYGNLDGTPILHCRGTHNQSIPRFLAIFPFK